MSRIQRGVTYVLRNVDTGKYINGKGDGKQVFQSDYSKDDKSQEWYLEEIANYSIRIKNKSTGKYINGSYDGISVSLKDPSDDGQQNWVFSEAIRTEKISGGGISRSSINNVYHLKNSATSKCLDGGGSKFSIYENNFSGKHSQYWIPILSENSLKGIWNKSANYDSMDTDETRLLVAESNGNYSLYKENDNMDIANAKFGVTVTKNLLGPQYCISTKASLINIHQPSDVKNDSFQTVDFDILSANAKIQFSETYVGAGAEVVLAGGKVSIFDLKLALGTETGVGIKDDSFTIKALGTGFTIGRKVGISALGSSFGVDFGRIFS